MTDEQVLALTLWGEARGEPIEGQIGVAMVIRNRAARQAKPCAEICLAPHQFSCWTQEVSAMADAQRELLAMRPLPADLQRCLDVARATLAEKLADNTSGSTHYLTRALFDSDQCPAWAKGVPIRAALGHHVFVSVP